MLVLLKLLHKTLHGNCLFVTVDQARIQDFLFCRGIEERKGGGGGWCKWTFWGMIGRHNITDTVKNLPDPGYAEYLWPLDMGSLSCQNICNTSSHAVLLEIQTYVVASKIYYKIYLIKSSSV